LKDNNSALPNDEELKKLRFSRHVTAFDVDINALDDHPWRNKNVDILDFFNYGFNERTWMVNNFLLLSRIVGLIRCCCNRFTARSNCE